MKVEEIFNQIYSNGILALAIALLAIAIMTYPTLRKYSSKKR